MPVRASCAQLGDQYVHGRHDSNPPAFDGYAFGLAQLCVTEVDSTDKQQRETIGELLKLRARPAGGDRAPLARGRGRLAHRGADVRRAAAVGLS
jgi:hypothetical protein